MNSGQVTCFLNAAARLSFTAAAGAIYLTPQAVSKQVISLEEELGTKLFDRNGPRLVLTESGRLYHGFFTAMDRQLQGVLEDIRLYRESRKLALTVGVSEWIDPSGAFQEGIDSFRAEHPNCKVSMRVYPNLELLAAIDSGEADCGFFSEGQTPPGTSHQVMAVAREEIYLYAPSDIPAGPAREDCWGLPLLMVPAWDWTNAELKLSGEREMNGVSLDPARTVRLPNLQTLYARMEFSRGVTLGGSRFHYLARVPGLTGHPTGVTDEIRCLWPRRSDSTLAPQLAEHLRKRFTGE